MSPLSFIFVSLLKMSYGSQSPALSSRYNYPNFFRTVPSSLGVVNVIIGLMNTYGWRKLYIIDQFEEPEFGTVSFFYELSNLCPDIIISCQEIFQIFCCQICWSVLLITALITSTCYKLCIVQIVCLLHTSKISLIKIINK